MHSFFLQLFGQLATNFTWYQCKFIGFYPFFRPPVMISASKQHKNSYQKFFYLSHFKHTSKKHNRPMNDTREAHKRLFHFFFFGTHDKSKQTQIFHIFRAISVFTITPIDSAQIKFSILLIFQSKWRNFTYQFLFLIVLPHELCVYRLPCWIHNWSFLSHSSRMVGSFTHTLRRIHSLEKSEKECLTAVRNENMSNVWHCQVFLYFRFAVNATLHWYRKCTLKSTFLFYSSCFFGYILMMFSVQLAGYFFFVEWKLIYS